MLHIYTVYPPHCQPEGPANDNKQPERSISFKLLMGFGIACLILLLPAAVIGGLLSMTVSP